jgi:hypothetical protein
MLNWLKRWRESNRKWGHGQNVVWPKFVAVHANGLTQFQHEAVQQLVASIGSVQLQQAGTTETYLTGKLPGTESIIFIYPDGAQIHSNSKAVFMAEREDHATPQELIEQFVAAANAEVQPNYSSKRTAAGRLR